MRTAAIAAFWARYVATAGAYPCASRVAHALPDVLVALTTRALVARVEAPSLRVGAVGDWLGHVLARHAAMQTLADVHGNPLLATMVPLGETPHGLELAVDLGAAGTSSRVVWLDPGRYDAGESAIVAVEAPSLEAWLEARAGDDDAQISGRS